MTSSIRALSRLGVLVVAFGAAACSKDATPATPSGTTTTTTGTGTSPPAAPACTYSLAPTSVSVGAAGGASTVTVTTQSGCTWTAATTASFITMTSGASGTGSGSVVINVAAASGANRTGTVTIAGQTFAVTQTGAGIIAGFNMFDPPSQTDATTACRIRGATINSLSTCPLTTTSRVTGTSTLVNWSWTVRYTYDGVAKTQTQSSGTIQDYFVNEFCGLSPSSAGGTIIPLTVSLTVTDSNGVQATATSGTGAQPALSMVAYTCGA